MATSYGALCTDFSVNHKLAMKMDLPGDRETILHLFDRVRKAFPSMDRFHPYENELALESPRRDPQYRCLTIRRRSIRTICFNGAKAEHSFRKYVLAELPEAPEIEYHRLPSTSPANASTSYVRKRQAWQVVRRRAAAASR